eukprot:GHRR01026791.1.p1 GENE.GHRR01026791.1~~GHRR01026791.1.p1  ORF type:complete len:134 (-),score=26.07 GHRR01026791.1:559-960(-)
MVQAKVGVCHEVHRYRHTIELVRGQGVCCTQQIEEIVCPEVVANIPKDGYPNMGLHPEPLVPGFALISLVWQQQRQEEAWYCCCQSHQQVAILVKVLIKLKWDQYAQRPQDPKGTIGQEKNLCPSLAGVGCQP